METNYTPPQLIPFYAEGNAPDSLVSLVQSTLPCRLLSSLPPDSEDGVYLQASRDGLTLAAKGSVLRGDFSKMLRRLTPNNLNGELIVKAARFANAPGPRLIVDATAGLGEDAFLLAAAGHRVILFERDPVIGLLLFDTLRRGQEDDQLRPILERMELHLEDSICAMPRLTESPDIVVLDPMFPERQKSGLIKKKFQLLHLLEQPCTDETSLLDAAMACHPRRIVIKRPAKGPYLGGKKPSSSIKGGSTRYDCIACR